MRELLPAGTASSLPAGPAFDAHQHHELMGDLKQVCIACRLMGEVVNMISGASTS
jgi:hypothetical protein